MKKYVIKVPLVDDDWCFVQDLLKYRETPDSIGEDTRLELNCLKEAKNHAKLWGSSKIYMVKENGELELVYER